MHAVTASDLGPADKKGRLYRAQHGGVDMEPVDRALIGAVTAVRAHVRTECILDAYWRRMQIIDRQREAGMLFRTVWLRSVQMPRVSADYGTRVAMSTGSDELPVVVASAKRRVADLSRMLNREQLAVVIAVCGMDEWAGGTKRLDDLRDGLTRMADVLRIEMPERRPT